jgi:hypothetical protein
MGLFLEAIRQDIREECKLCNALVSKISKMHFPLLPKDMLFVLITYITQVRISLNELAE